MIIWLWKGYHSKDLRELIQTCWQGGDLLIACPPHLKDLDFVKHLPAGDVRFCGDWDSKFDIPTRSSEAMAKYSKVGAPVLGVFTSGTISGGPRLVLYSKENIESSLKGILSLFDLKQIRTVFCYPQPFHTFGLLLGYFLSLALNARLETPKGKYGKESHEARLAITDPYTLTLGTPTHFHDLVEYIKAQKKDIESSYSCIIGGAPTSRTLWEQARNVLKIQKPSIGYGCTEASPGITHTTPGTHPAHDGEIGKPLSSLSATAGPDGVEISGAALCLAIINEDGVEFPKRLLIRDDVKVEDDGRWVYQGRLDLLLNRGGEKFSLEKIEQRIHEQLGISTVAVASKDSRLGQDLGLLVAGGNVGEDHINQIRALVQSQFSIRLQDSHIRKIKVIPQTSNGKVDRSTATDIFSEPAGTPVENFFQWLPHRPPMVWIDTVESLDGEGGGECAVKLRPDAAYFDDEHLRPSSFVEFMAQAYGYISAAQNEEALKQKKSSVNRAFLAAFKDVTLPPKNLLHAIDAGDILKIKVEGVRAIGPLTLYTASVLTAQGKLLSTGSLKVFAD